MASVNKVFLIGNLTAEPEIRQLPSGESVAMFSLAMNRRFTNARGEQVEDTTFVEIDAFSRTAEVIRQYVHKGDPLYVEGRLRQDRWQDKTTGAQRSRLKIVAEGIQLLSTRPGGAAPAGAEDNYGGAPQYRPQYQQPQYGQTPAPQYGYAQPAPAQQQPPQYRAATPAPPPAPMPPFQAPSAPPADAPVDDVPF